MISRLACLWVPSFPLAAKLRCQPDLKDEPLVIVEKREFVTRIIAAAPPAKQAGIREGMILSQARACLEHLFVHPRDFDAERAANGVLAEIAESFSPRIEPKTRGLVYLDITGTQNEKNLGSALMWKAADAGLPAQVGIGSGKLISCVASASAPSEPTIVSSGKEKEFLSSLPLSRLRPAARLTETLNRWGIRTIGQFAALPEGKILSHLGKEGLDLHKRAQGWDSKPLVPRRRDPDFFEGMEYDWPIPELESLLFLSRELLERLISRLREADLACRQLDVSLKLNPRGCDERTLPLLAPTRDLKTFLGLLRLELSAKPPNAPTVGISFLAHPETTRQVQLTLFGGTAISPDRISTTIS